MLPHQRGFVLCVLRHIIAFSVLKSGYFITLPRPFLLCPLQNKKTLPLYHFPTNFLSAYFPVPYKPIPLFFSAIPFFLRIFANGSVAAKASKGNAVKVGNSPAAVSLFQRGSPHHATALPQRGKARISQDKSEDLPDHNNLPASRIGT